MTNEMIILNERIRLLEEGTIKGTGNILEYEDEEGNLLKYEEPEEIHSYSFWKEHAGRVPKKGSKAIASFPIWKCTKTKSDKRCEESNENPEEDDKKMFLKMTYFFTLEQTEEIKAKDESKY